MKSIDQRIFDIVKGFLGDTRISGTVIYLSRNVFPAGANLQLGDALITIPWKANIVFVDFEPGVNWGHFCCYLVMNPDTGEIVRTDAQMPPFLKADGPAFTLLWRSPLAPEWAVETGSD